MSFQQGISLIELLISLFISSLLLVLINQQYINTSQQYAQFQSIINQKNDLQMLIQLLRDSSRRSGFSPCGNIEGLVTRDLKAIHIDDEKKELRLSRMSELFSRLLEDKGRTILLEKNTRIRAGDTLIIADCFHAETHRIKQSQANSVGQVLELEQPLIYQYQDPVYAGLWIEESFSIEKNPQQTFSMFYRFNKKEELSDFIIGMKTELVRKKALRFLRIILKLKNETTVELFTRVRAL